MRIDVSVWLDSRRGAVNGVGHEELEGPEDSLVS